jgi:hypothetical protein
MARVGGARHQALHLLRLAIANVLGTGVQLSCDGLDPAHELVAVVAATHSHYNSTTSSFQVQGGKFHVGRNFKFEVMNRGPSLAHIQFCTGPAVQVGHLAVAGFQH